MNLQPIDTLDIYLMHDQPTTCPMCSSRTDFEELYDGRQVHTCLNSDCFYQFTTEADDNEQF